MFLIFLLLAFLANAHSQTCSELTSAYIGDITSSNSYAQAVLQWKINECYYSDRVPDYYISSANGLYRVCGNCVCRSNETMQTNCGGNRSSCLSQANSNNQTCFSYGSYTTNYMAAFTGTQWVVCAGGNSCVSNLKPPALSQLGSFPLESDYPPVSSGGSSGSGGDPWPGAIGTDSLGFGAVVASVDSLSYVVIAACFLFSFFNGLSLGRR